MKKRIAECFNHLSLVATPSSVAMRANDTDSLVTAMGCKKFYDTSLKLWLQGGTHSKNTLKYIRTDQACEKYGSSLCNALPAFRAFMGVITQYHLKGKEKSHLLSC